MIKHLEGDEARYVIVRDRELLVSKMVFPIDYCVKFYGHFEQHCKEYFIYEFCSGGDLKELQLKQPQKRFTEVAIQGFIR